MYFLNPLWPGKVAYSTKKGIWADQVGEEDLNERTRHITCRVKKKKQENKKRLFRQ